MVPRGRMPGVSRRRVLLAGGLAVGGTVSVGGYTALASVAPTPYGAPTELRIATGPAGGVFREIGAALARVLGDQLPDTRIRLIPTGASVDNLDLLGRRAAELGFAALDTVTALVSGSPTANLTAIARLFDSWMQVLVPTGSPVTGLGDLADRPVAAGAAGSGTRFGFRRLVETAGISPQLVTASQDEGVDALARGAVVAFATFTGVPTPAVTRLVRTTPVRLLPLDREANGMISRFGGVYTAATLPSTTYPNVLGTPTLATPNLLLVRPDLPADVVYTITAALFGERSRIARSHPEANQINIRTGTGTMPVPLHPGAVRYFREVKP